MNNKVVFTEANRISNKDLIAYFKTVSQAQGGTWDGEDDDLLTSNGSEENVRDRFIKSYRLHAEKEFTKELALFSNLQTESAVEDYGHFLIENIEESILTRGRTNRLWSTAPLVKMDSSIFSMRKCP